MFAFVQNNRILISIILGLIALTFIGFGVSGYSTATEEPYLVKVGDAKIHQRELDEALKEIPQPVDDKAKKMILEQLIREELLLQEAKHNGIVVSKQQIADTIGSIPFLQENGKFNDRLYREFLQNKGFTAEQYEKKIERLLLVQTQAAPMTAAQFVSKQQAVLMAKIFGEERVVRPTMISPQSFADQVKLTDVSLKNYYQANAKRYRTPESVKVQYVILSQEAFANGMTVSDAEVRKYYDDHQKEFAQDKRRVAHILLQIPEKASVADKAKIRAQAETLLKVVKTNPTRFAEIAKQTSQDSGSAQSGGDLGFIEPGMMVKPFEDAANALSQSGEISNIVETKFGFHILKLEELQKAGFETAKTGIAQKLKMDKAAILYREKSKQLSDLAYNSDNLEKVATELNLPVETSDWLARNRSADPRLGTAKVMGQIFSDDVLKKKHNSEPVDIGSNTQIVVHVADHQPEKQLTFEEAKPAVTAELMTIEGSKLAAQHGEAALKALQEGKEAPELQWAQEMTLSKKSVPPGLAPEELMSVFSAGTKKLPAYVGIKRNNGSYLLFKIESVKAAAPATPEELTELTGLLGQANINAQLAGYLDELRKRYPVQMAVKPAQ